MVYVFLPVVGSTAGVPIVTRSPAVISVPKPVITFLPSFVMLDKSFFATPEMTAFVLATAVPSPLT